MKKRLFFMCLVLAMALMAVSAEPTLRWSWDKSENLATHFRYQIDGGEVVETSEKVVYSEFDGKSHVMNIWQSYDGKAWSEATECVYTPDAKVSAKTKQKKGVEVSVMASPYTFEGIAYVEDFAFIASRYGFGVEGSVVKNLGVLRLGVEMGYDTYSLSPELTYDRISDVFVGGTFGFRMASGSYDVYSDVEAGVVYEMLSVKGAPYAYVGVKSGIDYPVGDLLLKAQVAGRVAFQPQSTLSSSFNLVVTPSIGVGYAF